MSAGIEKLNRFTHRGGTGVLDCRLAFATSFSHRRENATLVATLLNNDELRSPLLTDFMCPVARFL